MLQGLRCGGEEVANFLLEENAVHEPKAVHIFDFYESILFRVIQPRPWIGYGYTYLPDHGYVPYQKPDGPG